VSAWRKGQDGGGGTESGVITFLCAAPEGLVRQAASRMGQERGGVGVVRRASLLRQPRGAVGELREAMLKVTWIESGWG
jgi:hypothetical protein